VSRPLLGILLLLVFGSMPASAADAPQIRSLVSDLRPLVGSAVEQCLELEYATLPRQPARIDWPLAEGVLSDDLPPRPLRRVAYQGEERLIESVCRRLVPLQAGDLTLPAAQITRGGARLAGGEAQLQVQALPQGGRPADFSGAVGSAQLQLDCTGAAGEETLCTVRLTGRGALDLFPLPSFTPERHGLQLESDQSRSTPDGMVRLLTYRATTPLPAALSVSLPLFDPQRGDYRQLHASLTIAGGIPWGIALPFLVLGVLLPGLWWQLRRRLQSPEQLLAGWCGVDSNAIDYSALLRQLENAGLESRLLKELEDHLQERSEAGFAPSVSARSGVRFPPRELGRLRKAIDKLGPYRR